MALGALAIPLAGGCAGPSLTLSTEPADAVVYVDGRRLDDGELPFAYYGTVAVDAFPAVREEPDLTRASTRRMVEIPEPVTPWILPFDFAGELLVRLFGGAPDVEVLVELPPNPAQIVEGQRPAEVGELSARAHAARVAR